MKVTPDIDGLVRSLNSKKKLSCPTCKDGMICLDERIDQCVEITGAIDKNNKPIETIIRLRHKQCRAKKKPRWLTLCRVCDVRSSESGISRVIQRCKCPIVGNSTVDNITTQLPPDISATNTASNEVGISFENVVGFDGGFDWPRDSAEISLGGPATEAGVGKISHDFDGGASDLCNNSEGVDSSRQRQVQMMDRELEASNVFENTNEYSKQTGEFLIREFIKKGEGCRGLVYRALIDGNRQSHFGDLADEEVHYHLHLAALHNGMPQDTTRGVCSMAGRMASRSNQEKEEELSAQRAAFIESIKHCLPDDTSLLENILDEVSTTMTNFHSNQRQKKKPNQAPDYNRIRSAYKEGANAITQNLPMPEVNIIHDCAHVSANQLVNHLLAFNKDVYSHRVGFDEDWMDGKGNYQCQYFRDVHRRVKSMMTTDPLNVSKETRVVFVRPWSDGFEAHKVKANNDYNNLQIFTVTLRAIRGKNCNRHTLPFGLCYKKKSHGEIFMQLLKEVQALETPRKRFFGEENNFHTTIVLIDMISADYPERCANANIAQLGKFTHRWGFSCQYSQDDTPSCGICEYERIKRLLGINTGDTDAKCNGCTDWWSEDHLNVHGRAERYPIEPGIVTPAKIPSVEITFEMLVNSMNDLQKWYNKSVKEIMNVRASKKKLLSPAKEHLARLGISSSLIPLLVEDMGKGINIRDSKFYQELWKKYEELNISMKQFASLLMHMTMLGVEKNLIKRTKMIVNRRKADENEIWRQLLNLLNVSLDEVEKASIEWCMPMSFSDKMLMGTARWLSDHFLSFTRLSLFFFGSLDEHSGTLSEEKKKTFAAFKRVRVVWFCLMSSILADEDVDAARIDDLVKLFLSSCRDWWGCVKDVVSEDEGEDEDDSGTTKRESKVKKKKTAKKNTGRKAVKNNTGRKGSTKSKKARSDVEATTKGGNKKKVTAKNNTSHEESTKSRKATEAGNKRKSKTNKGSSEKQCTKKRRVSANNMTKTAVTSNQNKSTENDKQVQKKKSKDPFFITGSNYLSLLNIAEMKVYFGPSLREFWESIHEKYIQNIKAEISNMRHTTDFLATILRKVLRRQALEQLIQNNPYQQKKEYARVDNFKIYKLKCSDQEPSTVLSGNNAVSGIIDGEGGMMLCVERKGQPGQFALHPVLFENDKNGFWRYDLWYSQAEIGPVSRMCTSRKEVLELASDYFMMLLPPIPPDATLRRQTVICRSWRVRNQNGELALPMPRKSTLLMQDDPKHQAKTIDR